MSPIEIRTRSLLVAANAARVTAVASTVTANAGADAALAAIEAAVAAAGYDSYRISGGVQVQVPDRLRGWSASEGVLPTSWSSIGLDALVTTYTAAKALQLKRDNELAGLNYLIAEANGLLTQDVNYESATAAADLATLSALLSSITTSMAA